MQVGGLFKGIVNHILGKIRVPALLLGALAVSFVLAEFATRLLLPDPRKVKFPFDSDYVEGLLAPHRTRDFAYSPNFVGRRTLVGNYDTEIKINSLGLRDDEVTLSFDQRPTILALGDSFTAGLGVQQDQAWPAQLEEALMAAGLNVRSINAGVSGYSMKQIRATAEELLPLIDPQLIIAGLFVGGHSRIQDPYVLLNGDWIRKSKAKYMADRGDHYYYSGPYVDSTDMLWLDSIIFRSQFLVYVKIDLYDTFVSKYHGILSRLAGRSKDEIAEVLSPMFGEIKHLAEFAASKKLPFIILLINSQDSSGDFGKQELENEAISEFASALGIPVVDPLPALKEAAGGKPILRFPDDGHWTPLAHQIVAAELAVAVGRLLSTSRELASPEEARAAR
jgi:lysophospholipase L1-like esterase